MYLKLCHGQLMASAGVGGAAHVQDMPNLFVATLFVLVYLLEEALYSVTAGIAGKLIVFGQSLPNT